MVYVIDGFGALFVVLSCTMLYAFHRGRNFGLFVMGVTYGASGLLAIALPHWWPLVAGFVLVWLLKLLGLEPSHEPPRDEGGGVRDEERGRRDEG
jgi:hypothetical protein